MTEVNQVITNDSRNAVIIPLKNYYILSYCLKVTNKDIKTWNITYIDSDSLKPYEWIAITTNFGKEIMLSFLKEIVYEQNKKSLDERAIKDIAMYCGGHLVRAFQENIKGIISGVTKIINSNMVQLGVDKEILDNEVYLDNFMVLIDNPNQIDALGFVACQNAVRTQQDKE